MNTSHTEYLNHNFDKKIEKITDKYDKYVYLKKNFIHLLSELSGIYELKKDRIHRELSDIKIKLNKAILEKNDSNTEEYSELFILANNEIQVINNFYKNKKNLNSIFNINVYNNILYKKTAVASSKIIDRLNKFTSWVKLVNNEELLISWNNILNECSKIMN